jgi:metal-responsive CopG/Arc/MetJ family transcriptional regulator
MARATFSLDEATIAEIKRTAERLKKPQSHVIREAVADYAARTDLLSERERRRVLSLLETLRSTKPTRSEDAVDKELADIRAARRGGGRRHTS